MKYMIYAVLICVFAVCTVRCAGEDLQNGLQGAQQARMAQLSGL